MVDRDQRILSLEKDVREALVELIHQKPDHELSLFFPIFYEKDIPDDLWELFLSRYTSEFVDTYEDMVIEFLAALEDALEETVDA